MGFDMMRKHIKVEPRRYYALCDRLGILVCVRRRFFRRVFGFRFFLYRRLLRLQQRAFLRKDLRHGVVQRAAQLGQRLVAAEMRIDVEIIDAVVFVDGRRGKDRGFYCHGC